jgi:hypothetical protein
LPSIWWRETDGLLIAIILVAGNRWIVDGRQSGDMGSVIRRL